MPECYELEEGISDLMLLVYRITESSLISPLTLEMVLSTHHPPLFVSSVHLATCVSTVSPIVYSFIVGPSPASSPDFRMRSCRAKPCIRIRGLTNLRRFLHCNNLTLRSELLYNPCADLLYRTGSFGNVSTYLHSNRFRTNTTSAAVD